MAIIVGSARVDERGKYNSGSSGDQKQISGSNDLKGEVSMQNMYKHSKGWYILRPISPEYAKKIAERMKAACNNLNIGYDQYGRLGIITYGIDTKVKTECDCSSLVRECVKEATGKDPGNFTTANEASMLEATGLFEKRIAYVSQAKTPVYDGDILVTKSKGHTVIVVSGNPRQTAGSSSKKEEYDMPVLKKGSKGKAVSIWQVIVGVAVDGDFGTKTYNATIEFQKAHGLDADGIVGRDTWGAGLSSV